MNIKLTGPQMMIAGILTKFLPKSYNPDDPRTIVTSLFPGVDPADLDPDRLKENFRQAVAFAESLQCRLIDIQKKNAEILTLLKERQLDTNTVNTGTE